MSPQPSSNKKQAVEGITYFISDLHLSDDRPDITQCFSKFMADEAHQADKLYILGDLFEVWIGDDDQSSFNQHIASIIANVGKKIPVYFIHGNRDFALGKKFSKQAHMQILPEQTVIDLYGRPTLISHGDELCTRDLEYMKFRKKSRGWWWPKLMLSLPLSYRKKIAEKGRKTSHSNKQMLASEIMDVTPSEVENVMQTHQVDLFIHGHTHRPNIHNFVSRNKQRQRIVLGDWYTQGSILTASPSSLKLENRNFI
ncbi:UDP-2,3-diacylglucosamine diphosphatase [Agaribacter flavus]|uniref:UDP-2,3-diacylglucosamine hydrolase n=1 Tax=Agaribacter flavus TaxID=1902781 RepID=A0ABV7FIX8_9ALTE